MTLNVQDVTLVFGNKSVEVEDANFINNNRNDTALYVILQSPRGGILLTVTAGYVAVGDEITITVTVTDDEGEPVEGAEVELYEVTT
jgi:protocatechuate 3,4-dioxygenase beta subunit